MNYKNIEEKNVKILDIIFSRNLMVKIETLDKSLLINSEKTKHILTECIDNELSRNMEIQVTKQKTNEVLR